MFYDKPMRHIELHTIESSKDVATANQIGFKVDNSETCEECFQQVGERPVSKKFVSFVLALDDDAEWVVCFECASPIL
jgi:hypothetical protein